MKTVCRSRTGFRYVLDYVGKKLKWLPGHTEEWGSEGKMADLVVCQTGSVIRWTDLVVKTRSVIFLQFWTIRQSRHPVSWTDNSQMASKGINCLGHIIHSSTKLTVCKHQSTNYYSQYYSNCSTNMHTHTHTITTFWTSQTLWPKWQTSWTIIFTRPTSLTCQWNYF